ncbi:hypothetical protein PV371_05615 [Streptomyces sp. TX20-6-3]|uniref:hypothetical protein n=1 Tax=Streptomyces sp. TX20-6-3 TaxID=3028705 RepID=UPI0029A9733E|nr:hypothetical protein [Streptomyces sp. TX20-6-3]MDX2559124.1 hypothetical protein [Streptomyces sp. TX20-6-3]
MRSVLARMGAAAAVVALLSSCSGGEGGDGTNEPSGLSAAGVCGGGFAKDAAATAALKAVMGGGGFHDGLAQSEPEKALDELRKASPEQWAESYRPEPRRYCWFWPAGDGGGEKDLQIQLSPARSAPGLHPEHAKKVTSYASGLQAYASSSFSRVYFSCRLQAPAHEIVVETVVRGPAGVPETDLEQRKRLVTLANAAARQVSGELGCEKDGLATGVPSPTAHPTS